LLFFCTGAVRTMRDRILVLSGIVPAEVAAGPLPAGAAAPARVRGRSMVSEGSEPTKIAGAPHNP